MKKDGERLNLIADKKYLSIFLILFLSIFLINQIPLTKATFQDNTSLQQIAYDCGGIFNVTNGVYRMNQSITASGTCFTISAQNITLDCNGNTLTYSTAGATSTYGIYTTQFNTTIKNCKVIDGNWTLGSPNTRYGILTQTQGNNTIYNNSVNVSNSSAIYILSTSQWNNLTGNNGTTNSSTAFIGGIRIDSGNNTLANNIGISTSSTNGIEIYSTSNNLLIRNNGTSVSGYGIHTQSSSNNILTNNNATSNSGSGIYVVFGSNNTLTSNIVTSNISHGIYLSSSNSNILIGNNGTSTVNTGVYVLTGFNNTLTNNTGASNASSGIGLQSSSNCTLTSNNGTSNAGNGIYLTTSQWNNLTGNNGTTNSSSTQPMAGIRLDSGNNTLTSNIGISTSSTIGITIYSTSNNLLIGNNGTSVSGSGIYIYLSSTNNTLINNIGTSNSGSGIYIYFTSNNNTLINNIGTSNSSAGIGLQSSQWNNLTGNTGITNSTVNSYGGFYLASGNNTLTNNIGIATSSSCGIILSSTSDNILIGNNATSNSSFGIWLATSTNNKLVNNNGTSNSNNGIYISSSSNNNNLTSNTGTSNSSYGIDIYSSSNNILTGNNGTSNSGTGIIVYTNSNNNTLIGNNGRATSIGIGGYSYGIVLSLNSNNTLISNNGTANSGFGISLTGVSNSTFISNRGVSNLDLGYGFYADLNCTNNTFYNLTNSDASAFSLKTNLNQSLISAILNSSCVLTKNTSSVNFSYKKSDESVWQTVTATRARDIYVVGDSISAGGLWEAALDSYMGSNSQFNNFAVGGEKCYQTYSWYLNNVTTNSNATVVVFCGVNDANSGYTLSNTTYYLEAMYNLSVARNQSIVFVNVGTKGLVNESCDSIIAINNWLSSFTASKGVPLVNFHSFMSTNASGCYANLSNTVDGFHPISSYYGYVPVGKLIWQQGFNSSITFALNKPLAHFDQGKTYDIKCTSGFDNNTFETYYTLPASFTSGGGIIDNASTLNTTLTNVTAKINESSYNSSSVYYDSTLINITSDTSNVEFNYNFSKYDFNFTSVSIDNETVGDKKFLSVWGIAEDGVVGTKSMKIYNANTAYNSVCVKDQENVTSISAACTDTNETKVLCDSNSHNGYTCTLSGTTLTITGLRHSGVMQMYQDVSVAAAEDTSGSGPGSFNPSNQTLENGYNANVAKDDKINFKFENETKTILIEKVSADNVEFSIDSKDYSVQINQTLKIDLNSDGYYDIQIFLKSVYSGRAILEVKLINEKIPAEEQASSQEQNKTENTPAEKKSNYKWVFIVGAIVLIAVVLKLFINKRHEKKFGKKY